MTKHVDVTILNGDRHMKHSKRHPRRNPDGALMAEFGKTLLATAAGAAVVLAGAYGAMKIPFGKPVTTDTAEQAAARAKMAKYEKDAVIALGAVALGAGLHVNGMAPRVGKAVMAGGVTLAAADAAMTAGLPDSIDSFYRSDAHGAGAGAGGGGSTTSGMRQMGSGYNSAGLNDWQSFDRATRG
jgi:hypothetical protein